MSDKLSGEGPSVYRIATALRDLVALVYDLNSEDQFSPVAIFRKRSHLIVKLACNNKRLFVIRNIGYPQSRNWKC